MTEAHKTTDVRRAEIADFETYVAAQTADGGTAFDAALLSRAARFARWQLPPSEGHPAGTDALTIYDEHGEALQAVYVAPAAETPSAVAPASDALPDAAAGWRLYDVAHLAVWLPESFVGGHPETDMPTLEAQAARLGPDWTQWFTEWHGYMQVAPRLSDTTTFPFVAFDSAASSPSRAGNVAVSFLLKRPAGRPDLTLRDHTDHMAAKIRQRCTLDQVEYTMLGDLPAAKLVYHGTGGYHYGLRDVCWLNYYVVTEGAAWSLVYLAPLDEATTWGPLFERSAATFRIKSESLAPTG